MIKLIVLLIDIVFLIKVLLEFYYILQSRKFIKDKSEYIVPKKVKILLLIPVLREQAVIENTLNHFKKLSVDNIELAVCIAGTSREKNNIGKQKKTTGEITDAWIKNNNTERISFSYYEIDELEGDRATQLNYAVSQVRQTFEPEIIGVYDADSLPDIETLQEVACLYCSNNSTVFQQPVNFIKTANKMSVNKENPILIANAMYQTTWTIIRELPRWYNHHKYCMKHKSKYKRNDYLIGHGEFFPTTIYDKFKFPENEVTDGIQIGYRMSMSGVDIAPLHSFCDDDVPRQLHQLIHQHKRWFGGCNRIHSANQWAKDHGFGGATMQTIDGYWSQFLWAYAAVVIVVSIILSIILAIKGYAEYLILTSILCILYWYVIPYISHKIIPVEKKISFISWLMLPIAMAVKCLGPNLYLIQTNLNRLFSKKMSYEKVER